MLGENLLKALWEKGKGNHLFSFSLTGFYLFKQKFHRLVQDKVVVCKSCRMQMNAIWKILKFCRLVYGQPFPKQALIFTCLQLKSLENTVGKGEIVRNVFSTRLENFMPFSSNSELSSANSFRLEESKICRLGKG